MAITKPLVDQIEQVHKKLVYLSTLVQQKTTDQEALVNLLSDIYTDLRHLNTVSDDQRSQFIINQHEFKTRMQKQKRATNKLKKYVTALTVPSKKMHTDPPSSAPKRSKTTTWTESKMQQIEDDLYFSGSEILVHEMLEQYNNIHFAAQRLSWLTKTRKRFRFYLTTARIFSWLSVGLFTCLFESYFEMYISEQLKILIVLAVMAILAISLEKGIKYLIKRYIDKQIRLELILVYRHFTVFLDHHIILHTGSLPPSS